MYDFIISSNNQMIWRNQNSISFFNITDIKKCDDRLRFRIKDGELICSFCFKTKKTYEVYYKYPLTLQKIEKSILGFKYQKEVIPTWNDNQDVYKIIVELKELFGFTNSFENELFQFQRNIELVKERMNEK